MCNPFQWRISAMKVKVSLALAPVLLLTLLPACTAATPIATATAVPAPIETATSVATVSGAVVLQYLGQACILITAPDGTRIVSDPYGTYEHATGLDPLPADLAADAVTVSHAHPDHNATNGVGGSPQVIRVPGIYQVGMFTVTGYKGREGSPTGPSYMDNTIFVFEAAGVKIVSLGDSGPVTDADVLAGIEHADVILINIDNYVFPREQVMPFMQQIHAHTVIPDHYGILPDGTSAYREKFLAILSPDVVVVTDESGEIHVTPDMPVQVDVLTPQLRAK
jgi:L-ascorbate metabolism protein UlaG (beta-lactamase superfamily)